MIIRSRSTLLNDVRTVVLNKELDELILQLRRWYNCFEWNDGLLNVLRVGKSVGICYPERKPTEENSFLEMRALSIDFQFASHVGSIITISMIIIRIVHKSSTKSNTKEAIAIHTLD